MPILTLTIIGDSPRPPPHQTAARLAATIGWAATNTWLITHHLDSSDYGEGVVPHPAPVLVRALLRDGGATQRGTIAATIGRVVAEAYGRDPNHIHVIFEAAGDGRVAFGGKL